jgi:nicotinamide-nucleotide amidase
MDPYEQWANQIAERAGELGVSVGVAESLTGGLVVQALAKAPAASEWLRGGLVAYARGVKHDALDVTASSVVSEQAAREMAAGTRRLLGADVALSVTGVGGPEEQDGEQPGTVWIAVDDGAHVDAFGHHFEGEPAHIVDKSRLAALQALADRLDSSNTDTAPIERVGG